jgi:hypothetical protein
LISAEFQSSSEEHTHTNAQKSVVVDKKFLYYNLQPIMLKKKKKTISWKPNFSCASFQNVRVYHPCYIWRRGKNIWKFQVVRTMWFQITPLKKRDNFPRTAIITEFVTNEWEQQHLAHHRESLKKMCAGPPREQQCPDCGPPRAYLSKKLYPPSASIRRSQLALARRENALLHFLIFFHFLFLSDFPVLIFVNPRKWWNKKMWNNRKFKIQHLLWVFLHSTRTIIPESQRNHEVYWSLIIVITLILWLFQFRIISCILTF